MSLALTSKLSVALLTQLTNPLDNSTPADNLDLSKVIRLASGTTADHADREFHDTRTLATGATEDLDLAGVLTDPLGNTLTFATIKGILVIADTANTTSLTFGNGSNPWIGPWGATGTEEVKPGGMYHNIAPGTGWAVTPATGDVLKVANAAGASATYKIALIGTSA
ncbi:MAG: hypothetical protein JXA67_20500 [Micromonosporaceae bacterium]|nr:hypothetical protein [Micromonosporaceae bacterium]